MREREREVRDITRFGLRRKEGRDPSCSQPRNNVGGLWFFIRARSHNGERVISVPGKPKAFSLDSPGSLLVERREKGGKNGKERQRKREDETAFVSTLGELLPFVCLSLFLLSLSSSSSSFSPFLCSLSFLFVRRI